MRVPSDLPRPRRPRVGNRGRVGLIVLAVVVVVLLTSLRGIAGFYTDLIWFDSLGYRGVFTGILGAKISLTLLFTAVFFVVLWANLVIADRLAPRFRPAGPEEEVIERYHELIGNRTGLVRTGVALLLAVVAGAGVSGRWHDWVLFTNARDFGIDDPQFNMDVGFYIFRLPFLTFIVDWAFGSLLVITLVTAVAHYLNGGIRVQGPLQRVTPQVKAHLSVLLGLLAVIKAVGYWFQRYELTLSTRGTVDGASYTDVKAQLPAINLLMLISAAAVVLLIVNIWRRGWVLPVLAVGLWAFVAVVVGTIYPAIIQRVRVEPAESSREAPYIERNIEATRAAMGLSDVEQKPFAATADADASTLVANAATVRNIRLWDHRQMREAFSQLQAAKAYYRINDVDVDRYMIDGELTQVMLGVRDLDREDTPQRSWEARHLTYTHGQGLVMAPTNAKDENGRPQLLVKDVPVDTSGGIQIDQPDVYIGEQLTGYVITDTDRPEVDFEDDEGTKTSSYDGADGVGIGSYFRRAAFALRFGDVNPLISGNIRSDSKILIHRDVRERVTELAPFLSFDNDPYAVVVDGRIKYVIDAYTTSSRYPYAQRADRAGLPEGSGLDHNFNYARNSVKAVVDAYDGDVTFYVVDPTDPLAAAYVDAFPELFTDGDEAPDELREHFRYPEDLFIIQTNMWGRYHLSDPDAFYTRSGAWVVSQDPELTRTTATTTPGQQPTDVDTSANRMEPYYLLTQLPGESEPSFLILRPFVPVSERDERKELTAFMVAKSDPDEYGQLTTFVVPSGKQVDGPAIAAANMQAETEVAETQTLLGQRGSEVSFGNLIVVPIEESLLFVRPFYVTANTTRIPEIRKVVAAYGDDVAIADTLQEALSELFGDAPPTQEEPVGGTGDDDEATETDVDELLAEAVKEFDAAQDALEEGDLGEYQRRVNRGRELVRQAQEQSAPSSTTTTTAPADA